MRSHNRRKNISIHALLAESDWVLLTEVPYGQYFYPRSPCGERLRIFAYGRRITRISIHALLAESDVSGQVRFCKSLYFYPRSPCGERRIQAQTAILMSPISIHALLAESDVVPLKSYLLPSLFLSTLSLRRATRTVCGLHSDCIYFYPRSPCGERLRSYLWVWTGGLFLSTLSLRRATIISQTNGCTTVPFLSTLSLRRATARTLSIV